VTRFEQRRTQRLTNPEVAAGYREMDAELSLVQAMDALRKRRHLSKEQLAARMSRSRPAISRILNGEDSNPTLETITGMLEALDVTAEVTLRPRVSDEEAPLRVVTVF
jgi:transcriptional regulator with XRE-family HTH domain